MPDHHRTVLSVTGVDRQAFLQGLVTNDVARADLGLVHAALLSPQGKYMADFFLLARGDAVLVDVAADLAATLEKRLAMYRLRARVTIGQSDLVVSRGLGAAPAGSHPDPRHPALGWRHYGATALAGPAVDWDAIRVAHCIPESGIELIPDDSYILEAGFERLHGVDFRKGCYVGQEVTARMKHKTELRKGLALVTVEGDTTQGSEIAADGKAVGTLFTRAGDQAIAYLRFDRTDGPMQAGAAMVRFLRHGDDC